MMEDFVKIWMWSVAIGAIIQLAIYFMPETPEVKPEPPQPTKAIITSYATGKVRTIDITGYRVKEMSMLLERADTTTLYVSFCENEIELK